jgi:chromosome segregation ATPase
MTDKNRTVILGVVVALFIVANIIAGIGVYKLGKTGTTPQKQVTQVGETVETGGQPQEVKEQGTEVKASEPPVAETEVQKDSEEAVAEAVIEEKSTAQSGEDSQPETGTVQSVQQQIAAYESEKSELEEQIVRLREELRDKQTLAAENQQLSEQVRESSAERKRLQKELAVVQTNDEKYRELSAQNKNLVYENKKLQAQLEDAKRQNDILKARLDKIRTMAEGE